MWLILPTSDESVPNKKAINGQDVVPSNIPRYFHLITAHKLDMIKNEPLHVIGKKFVAKGHIKLSVLEKWLKRVHTINFGCKVVLTS
jgi:hypothetical protein